MPFIPRPINRSIKPKGRVEANTNQGVIVAKSFLRDIKNISPVYKLDKFGPALAGNGLSSGGRSSIVTPALGTEFTLTWIGIWYGNTSQEMLFELTPDSNSFYINKPLFLITNSDSFGGVNTNFWSVSCYGNSPGTYGTVAFLKPPVGVPLAISIYFNNSLPGHQCIIEVWINGKKQTLINGWNTRAANTGPEATTGYVLARNGSSLYANAGVHAVGFSRGNVAMKMSINPWQMFQPGQRPTWFYTPISYSAAPRLESLAYIAVNTLFMIESPALISTTARENIEALTEISIMAMENIEALSTLSAGLVLQAEALQHVRYDGALSIEVMATISAGAITHVEALQSVTGIATLSAEMLQAIARSMNIPAEALQVGSVSVNVVVNLISRTALFQVLLNKKIEF